LLFGLTPSFEPGLIAAQDVRVCFSDGLLQFGDSSHLIRKAAVKPD